MKLILLGSDSQLHRLACEGTISRTGGSSVNPLEDTLGSNCYASKVLLNLEKVSSIDSTGIGWLVRCHKNFTDAGGKMVLHSVPPLVSHVIRLINLDSYFHIAEDEKAGVVLLSEGQ